MILVFLVQQSALEFYTVESGSVSYPDSGVWGLSVGELLSVPCGRFFLFFVARVSCFQRQEIDKKNYLRF